MALSKRIGKRVFHKEKLKFETDLQKEIHRIVSSIKYGDTFHIETCYDDNTSKQDYVDAIYKSAFYNNIDIRLNWDKSNKIVTIYCDW